MMIAVVPPVRAQAMVHATVDSQPINLFVGREPLGTGSYPVFWLPAASHHDPSRTGNYHTFCHRSPKSDKQVWGYFINANREISHKMRGGKVWKLEEVNDPIGKKFSFATVIRHLYARTEEVNRMSKEMTRQRVYCFLKETPGTDYTKIKLDGPRGGPTRQDPKPDHPTEPTKPETATGSSNPVDSLNLQFGSLSTSEIAHLFP